MKETGIRHFEPSQIYVCHPVGSNKYSPLIVRFRTKNDRMSFFNQRKSLKKINDLAQFDLGNDCKKAIDNRPDKSKVPFYIIQENLTKMNADLLKLARDKAKSLQYLYPGYIAGGQVRVRKTQDGSFISIQRKSDINKIL